MQIFISKLNFSIHTVDDNLKGRRCVSANNSLIMTGNGRRSVLAAPITLKAIP